MSHHAASVFRKSSCAHKITTLDTQHHHDITCKHLHNIDKQVYCRAQGGAALQRMHTCILEARFLLALRVSPSISFDGAWCNHSRNTGHSVFLQRQLLQGEGTCWWRTVHSSIESAG